MKFKFYAIKLSALCVIVFLLQIFISGFTELFVLDENAYGQYWRFLTAIFLHGGFAHLLYNLLALALFGSVLESKIGWKNFLAVFFISGIIANIVALYFYPNSLGASGAIFGIIGALIFISPFTMVWTAGLPMPLFLAGILWVTGDLVGAYAYVAGNPIDNTGNIAHLGGVIIGLIMGFFYRFYGKINRS